MSERRRQGERLCSGVRCSGILGCESALRKHKRSRDLKLSGLCVLIARAVRWHGPRHHCRCHRTGGTAGWLYAGGADNQDKQMRQGWLCSLPAHRCAPFAATAQDCLPSFLAARTMSFQRLRQHAYGTQDGPPCTRISDSAVCTFACRRKRSSVVASCKCSICAAITS